MKKFILSFLFLSLMAGCSSKPTRPKLYPNTLYNTKGLEGTKSDIDECLAKAQEYLNTPEGKELKMGLQTRHSSFGTSVGFGFGSSRRTSFGLGFGNTYGNRDSLSSEEKVVRIFTNKCLEEKGYEVLGWGS